jgi:hypothetical protein
MRFSKKDECLSFQKAHCLDHGMENNFIQGVENDVYAHVTQRHAAIVIQTGNIKVEDNIDNEDDMEEDAMWGRNMRICLMTWKIVARATRVRRRRRHSILAVFA